MKEYELSELNIKHIRTTWKDCIAGFLNIATYEAKEDDEDNNINYIVSNFITDPLYLDTKYKVEHSCYITVTFIHVRKCQNRVFICYSDHPRGVFERIGKKDGYICSSENLLTGPKLEEKYYICHVDCEHNSGYIYVDWITGKIHNMDTISSFVGYLNMWIGELRDNILTHIIIYWRKLFEMISSKNIKTCTVTCNNVRDISNMITVKTVQFIFIYNKDTIFYFFSHVHDIEQDIYKCNRNNSLCENYCGSFLHPVKEVPSRITIDWYGDIS